MKNLIIIGIGGFAREVYWFLQKSIGFGTDWQVKGFLDGDVKLAAEEYMKLPKGVPVLGDVDSYEICENDIFTCAIGNPKVRRKLVEKMLERGAEFTNIISQDAFIMPTAKIGRGVIICLYCGVSDHAEIGDFCVMNSSTFVGHDAKVKNYSCIMSHVGIGGAAQIGAEVFIGSSVTILPKAKIGDGAYIGAASVVLKKVKENAEVFGNPAVVI